MLVLLLLLVLVRGTNSMTWLPPTTYTDNTPFGTGELAGTNIYRQVDGGAWVGYGSVLLQEQTFVDTAPIGTSCYYATAMTTGGSESAPSNILCFKKARPPQNLSK